MFLVDTHCHLDLIKGIEKDPTKENKLGVKTIAVTNAPFLFRPNSELFAHCSNIRVALGMHPELVNQYHTQLEIFESHILSTKYIGEIGLDGSASHKTSFGLQLKTFEKILSLIAISNEKKILTIHSRGAEKETISTLNKYLHSTPCKVIFHWYSGNLGNLKAALDCGYYFSINHKMVNTGKGIEIIKNLPLGKILTETDAPFTLDVKIKDRLSSLEASLIGIANIKNRSKEEVKIMIAENFKSVLS